MNTQNLINLIYLPNIDTLSLEQLTSLLAQAYLALAELEVISIEYLKLLAVIRRIEMRIAEIKSLPRPTFHPRPTP